MIITKETLDGIRQDINAVIASIKGTKNWTVKTFTDLADVVEAVIVKVEDVSNTVTKLTGIEKRQLACDLIASYINISWIPTWVISKAIGYLIDYTVSLYNRFGKDFISKIGK